MMFVKFGGQTANLGQLSPDPLGYMAKKCIQHIERCDLLQKLPRTTIT